MNKEQLKQLALNYGANCRVDGTGEDTKEAWRKLVVGIEAFKQTIETECLGAKVPKSLGDML